MTLKIIQPSQEAYGKKRFIFNKLRPRVLTSRLYVPVENFTKKIQKLFKKSIDITIF